MQQTRRQFMGTATALSALVLTGAAPAPVAEPSGLRICKTPPLPVGKPRQSLAVFAADFDKVASLRKAVATMKKLPASDHRSWFFQAATHAYSPTLLKAEERDDPKLKTFDKTKYWNKCPHFGQCSADFVIWHRAFLYFFERHLRDAAQDADLSLPYWNYGLPDQRTFPEIYAAEYTDPAKTKPNPLYHPNREKSFTRGLLEISGVIGQADKTLATTTFFHEVGAPGFGGDHLDEDHTQKGLLEQRPHNDIHLAVGGVINSSNGAMAEITTAAFDPVFWAHHANIDRLWAEWSSKPGKSWGTVPSPGWFDERPWTFLDIDGSERTMSRREAIELVMPYDVAYATQLAVPGVAPAVVAMAPAAPSATPPAAAAPPPPPATTTAPSGGGNTDSMPMPEEGASAPPPEPPTLRVGAAPPKKKLRPTERELAADNTPMIVTPHNSGRRLFGEPAPSGQGGRTNYAREGKATTTLVAPELANKNAKILLELTGITFKLVPSSGFAVYLDCAGQPAADEPVGLIDIFGATHGSRSMIIDPKKGHTMSIAQRFDVTAIVRKSPGPFTVRVEPYALLVTRTGAETRGRADAVTISGVRFVVLTA